jgi:PAS domain S-box-containing protein
MTDKLAESYSRLEEKVKERTEELEKFQLAVDNASDQIVMTDADGTVLYANAVLKKNTGYTPEEAMGQKAGKLWGGLMSKEFYQKMWHRIKIEKKPFIGQLQNKRKSGEIYDVDVHISPILNSKGEVMFFVALEQDITKEKAIDRAKTEFVSVASHQLRSPLSAIKWASEILLGLDAGKLNKKQLQYIQEIRNGNERMIELVNTLLNVSRIELGTYAVVPRKINIADILDEVLSDMKNEIKAKHLILSRDVGRIPPLMADPIFIRIILQNLITNAVKYTPEKGSITVTLGRHKDSLRLSVKDTGYGIPKSAQSNIFTKLFRAENIQKMSVDGNGLGLYITKSIVEKAVNGTIWFESEENIGSTFYVEIPLSGMAKKEGTKYLT